MNSKATAKRSGYTLVEMMITCSLIGMFAALACPYFFRARQTAQTNTCIKNLREIQSATQTWALETNRSEEAAVTEADVLPYLKYKVVCPAGGTTFADSYAMTDVLSPPTCRQVAALHLLAP